VQELKGNERAPSCDFTQPPITKLSEAWQSSAESSWALKDAARESTSTGGERQRAC
jgi:hypothetical protein